MIEFGVNADPRHGYNPTDIIQPGSVPWIRSVEHPDHDLTEWLTTVRDNAGKNLVVVDADSITGTYQNTAKRLRTKYGRLVDAWQIGNEPDGTGDSSWSLPPSKFDALLWAFRVQMPMAYLVAGGLSSGDPNYLLKVNTQRVNAIAVHPYGQRVYGFPSPTWGFGEVGDLINSYRRFGKPVWVTEYGGQTVDYPGGVFAVEDQRAQYHSEMALRLHELDVQVACVYCWADSMVPGFGLVEDSPANARATYAAFYNAAQQVAQVPSAPAVSYVPGVIAGWFASPPQGVIIHSTRSGTNNNERQEFDTTVNYVKAGASGLGWHATIGPNIIAGHMPANQWGWNARQHSSAYLAVELAQAKLGQPISDAIIDATAYWIRHYAATTYPDLLHKIAANPQAALPMHSELQAGIADGKTDAAPRGAEAEAMRQRILARL